VLIANNLTLATPPAYPRCINQYLLRLDDVGQREHSHSGQLHEAIRQNMPARARLIPRVETLFEQRPKRVFQRISHNCKKHFERNRQKTENEINNLLYYPLLWQRSLYTFFATPLQYYSPLRLIFSTKSIIFVSHKQLKFTLLSSSFQLPGYKHIRKHCIVETTNEAVSKEKGTQICVQKNTKYNLTCQSNHIDRQQPFGFN
jgi:hypothetical protein